MEDTSVAELLAAACRCIESSPLGRNVTLITLDSQGFPSARTLTVPEIADDLSYTRLNTKKHTRKVSDISKNSKVALHFCDQRGLGGWLTIKGTATLHDTIMERVNICIDALSLQGLHPANGLAADWQSSKQQPVELNLVQGSWCYPVRGSELSCSDACFGFLQLFRNSREGSQSTQSDSIPNLVAATLDEVGSIPSSSVQVLLDKAKRCIQATPLIAVTLITVDEHGFPSARMLPVLEIATGLEFVRFTAQRGSTEVLQIQANQKVAVSFEDQRDMVRPGKIGRGGWLVLKGHASAVEKGHGATDIIVRVKQIEGVDYVEEFMAGSDGYAPAILTRSDSGIWSSLS